MVQQPKTLTFQNSRHPRQKATTATRISSRVSESLRLSRAELNFTPATPAARFIWEKNVRFPEKNYSMGEKKHSSWVGIEDFSRLGSSCFVPFAGV
jgi:hypothetical protein